MADAQRVRRLEAVARVRAIASRTGMIEAAQGEAEAGALQKLVSRLDALAPRGIASATGGDLRDAMTFRTGLEAIRASADRDATRARERADLLHELAGRAKRDSDRSQERLEEAAEAWSQAREARAREGLGVSRRQRGKQDADAFGTELE